MGIYQVISWVIIDIAKLIIDINYKCNVQCIIYVRFEKCMIFENWLNKAIKFSENDFDFYPRSDLRYHQVFQTSRANLNDLHLYKLEIICIIDVSIVCK